MKASPARNRANFSAPSVSGYAKKRIQCRVRAANVASSGDNNDYRDSANTQPSFSNSNGSLGDHAAAVDGSSSNGTAAKQEYSTRSEIIPLLKFALPTLCIAVTSPLLSLVDTSVVGLASEAQLAAMAPATALSDGVGYILTFIPTAVTNLVALHMARKHPRAAGAVVSEALALSTVICIVIAGALLTATPAFFGAVASLSPDMIVTATEYVRWRAVGLPFAIGYSVMQACFLACQAPRIPMLATVAAGVVNLVGDLLLCQVFNFGAAGAAAATSAANIVVFFLMLHFIRRPLPESSAYGGQRLPVRALIPNPATVTTFLSIAGPVLGVVVMKVLLFGMIAARAAEAGAIVSAGHQILFSTAMFFGVFGDTVCHAAQAFLPPKIGNPRAAWAFSKAIFACGAIIGTFNVFASTAFAYYTVPLFTGSAAVQGAVRVALPLFAVHLLLHCCSMGTEGVLLAARDGWFLLGTYLFAFAVIRGVVNWAMAQGWGLAACWFTTATFMALRLCMNSVRLLAPGSVLSRTEPLSDKMQDLEEKARELAAVTGSPFSDTESDSEGPGAPPPAAAPLAEAAAAAAAGHVAFEDVHGRPGGRGRGTWLTAAAESDSGAGASAAPPASAGNASFEGMHGRPGGRGRGTWPGASAHESASDPDDASADGIDSDVDVLAELGRPGGRARGAGLGIDKALHTTAGVSTGAGPDASAHGSASDSDGSSAEGSASNIDVIGELGRPGGRAREGGLGIVDVLHTTGGASTGAWPGAPADESASDSDNTSVGGGDGDLDVIGELGRPGGRARRGGVGIEDVIGPAGGVSTGA